MEIGKVLCAWQMIIETVMTGSWLSLWNYLAENEMKIK